MTETRHGVSGDEVPEAAAGKAAMWREFDKATEEALDGIVSPTERAEVRRNAARTKERWGWFGDEWPTPKPGPEPKKVAIVGFATTRVCAPYGEEGWELWSLNDPVTAAGYAPRSSFTRWFQLHPPRYLAKHYTRGLQDLAMHWGERTGIRLYMDQHYPEYPDSEPYPKEAVEQLSGHGWYHTSSFDWMLALAIHEGFEEIAIYGCQFYSWPAMNGEPISALQCLHYWVGVAEGRGIKVSVHGGGHLFSTIHLASYTSRLQYGFEHEPGLDLGTDVDGKWEDVRR